MSDRSAAVSWDRQTRYLRRIYYSLIFINNELRSATVTTLDRRVRLFLKGFYSTKVNLYDFDRWGASQYLSDLQFYIGTGRLNGEYRRYLNDKLAFYGLMAPVQEYLPHLFAVVHKGKLRSATPEDEQRLRDHLRGGRSIVVKPTHGGGGESVTVWSQADSDDRDPLDCLRRDVGHLADSIVVEFVRQAEYSQDIFGGSTNTIRILTIWDDLTDKPFLAFAAHRFGSKLTRPVDNFSRGGLSVLIDRETGVMGPAARRRRAPSARSGEIEWIDHHPDTEARIHGESVPNWHHVTTRLLEVAGRFPYLPYVGWDVVVTEDSFQILEANSTPDVDGLQMHRPLLLDERVRSFFSRRGVI